MKTFVPSSTQLSPSRRARVRRLETSEPACGSVTANAATAGSSAVPNILGAHSRSCSGVPPLASDASGSPVPKIERPIPAQPQKTSSMTNGSVSPVGSAWCCR